MRFTVSIEIMFMMHGTNRAFFMLLLNNGLLSTFLAKRMTPEASLKMTVYIMHSNLLENVTSCKFRNKAFIEIIFYAFLRK